MELFVSATRASHYNCKLTPKRTELLIVGYCNIHKRMLVPMDLTPIIILYFNQLLYWKALTHQHYRQGNTNKNITQMNLWHWDSQWESLVITTPDIGGGSTVTASDIRSDIEALRNRFASPYIERLFGNLWYIIFGLDQVCNKYPLSNNFQFSVSHSESITIELMNGWDNITNIVLRIRVFCVENQTEIEKLLNLTEECQSVQVCDNKTLKIESTLLFFSILFSNNLSHHHNDLNIGCEVEILHILYKDGNYWSKWPYSWFNRMIDANTFIKDNLSPTHVNYYNSGCFKVDDKYYYLINTFEAKCRFFQLIDHYFMEALQLQFDIVLLLFDQNFNNKGKQISLFDYLNYTKHILQQRKQNVEHEKAIMIKNNEILMKLKRENEQSAKRYSMKHICKRPNKLYKTYRNSKRKYGYNRW